MFQVGEIVKVKTASGMQFGRIEKSGRNKCLVMIGIQPEKYEDIDYGTVETRWVEVTSIKEYKPRFKK